MGSVDEMFPHLHNPFNIGWERMHIWYWPTRERHNCADNMLANNLKLSVPVWYLGSSLVFSWGLSLEEQLSPASSVLPLITIVGGRCWSQKSCQRPYISKCHPTECHFPGLSWLPLHVYSTSSSMGGSRSGTWEWAGTKSFWDVMH